MPSDPSQLTPADLNARVLRLLGWKRAANGFFWTSPDGKGYSNDWVPQYVTTMNLAVELMKGNSLCLFDDDEGIFICDHTVNGTLTPGRSTDPARAICEAFVAVMEKEQEG